MDIHTISLLLGAFVGILLALTGAGGGIVTVPLLVFGLHMTVTEASPVGLLAVMLAAGVGAVVGLRKGNVRYKAAGLMAACGMLVFPIGLWMAHSLPDIWLTLIFAVVLMFVSFRMYRHSNHESDALGWQENRPAPPCQLDQMRGKLKWTTSCVRSIVIAGALAGLLSGLLGVGGGFIIVPALRKFTNLDIKSIVSTSLTTIALVSSGGTIIATLKGLINWNQASLFAIGATLGMVLGIIFLQRISNVIIQKLFSIFAFLVGIGLLLKNMF